MPPDIDDNDIPSPDDFAEGGAAGESGAEEAPDAAPARATSGTGTDQPGAPSPLAELLGAHGGALRTLGQRAAEVFALGLESVVAQKPDVRVLSADVAEYATIAAEFADVDHFAIEVRFALSETEAQPVAVLLPFADLGRIFMVGMSAEEMADDAFASGQVELVTQGTRELLDLAGLMLFIDELAGGEATLAAVRLRAIDATIAVLQEAGQGVPAVRIVLALVLPGGAEAQAVLVVPGSLVLRLGALLAAPPARRADPSSPPRSDPAPMLRAVGGSEDRGADGRDNISPLRGSPGSRAAEPEVSVHPVRFPPLSLPDQNGAAQQQMDLILDVPLRVSVELGRSSMTVEEVLALGPGSVVELNKLAGEPVDVLVNDRLIARGEVVVVDENFGVRVTEVLSPRSRANALAR